MQLVNVDVIGAQRLKARLQIAPESHSILRHRFGGDCDLIAHSGKRQSQLVFAVGIRARRIKKRHSAFIRTPQKRDRILI